MKTPTHPASARTLKTLTAFANSVINISLRDKHRQVNFVADSIPSFVIVIVIVIERFEEEEDYDYDYDYDYEKKFKFTLSNPLAPSAWNGAGCRMR